MPTDNGARLANVDKKVDSNGRVVGFQFYAVNVDSPLHLEIWRPTSQDEHYMYVEHSIFNEKDGREKYDGESEGIGGIHGNWREGEGKEGMGEKRREGKGRARGGQGRGGEGRGGEGRGGEGR